MRRVLMVIAVVSALGCACAPALAQRTLREIARINGENEYKLQGIGLVVGLPGTGDSGDELVMARPLAQTLRAYGNEIPTFEDLESTRSVALVMVSARVPRAGARVGDQLDVTVSTLHSAKSVEGGVLLATPLVPAVRGQTDKVYAIAGGKLLVEDRATPTVGVVRNAADVVADVINTPSIRGGFDLIIDAPYRGWGAAAEVAAEINQQYLLTTSRLAEPLARAISPNTVRVTVPANERADPALFVGEIMQTDITGALRDLPAQVICNTRSGIILVTGDVLVSPAVITHNDLTITTTLPPPEPDPNRPVLKQSRWATVETDARPAQAARLQDLLEAFDQLDVPAVDQIQILQMLHRAGKLHAKLLIDEA